MKVISLINMKGGVGKTTLSTNICDCLTRRNKKKVLLIDIDPQFNATQCLFSGDEYIQLLKDNNDTIINVFENTSRSLASTVSGLSELKPKNLKDIKPQIFKENFHILPGNLDLYRLEMAPGSGRENRLNRFIQEIQKNEEYDYIIIDTPPTPSIWMTSALLASDYYLIPVKPDPISYIGVDLLETIIEDKREDLNIKITCIGLVFSMVERSDSVVYQSAIKQMENGKWKKYRYLKYIPKRADIAKFQLNKSFILDIGDGFASSSLAGIVSELEKRINDDE